MRPDDAAGPRTAALAIPEPDRDNPLPIVLAKDGTVVLSYKSYVARKEEHIIVSFHVAYDHRFGPPGREGLASHPLAARGLKPDGAFEVKNSAWTAGARALKAKHYLFTFRDAVFECLADGYGYESVEENADVVRLMARNLYK